MTQLILDVFTLASEYLNKSNHYSYTTVSQNGDKLSPSIFKYSILKIFLPFSLPVSSFPSNQKPS